MRIVAPDGVIWSDCSTRPSMGGPARYSPPSGPRTRIEASCWTLPPTHGSSIESSSFSPRLIRRSTDRPSEETRRSRVARSASQTKIPPKTAIGTPRMSTATVTATTIIWMARRRTET